MEVTERGVSGAAQVVARSSLPIANATFTPGGRLVVSHHPVYEPHERVSIFTSPADLEPFPNADWNDPSRAPNERLDAVQGLRTDSHGHVWLLDMGTRSDIPTKFVVWDPMNERLVRVLEVDARAFTEHSEPNDFVLDERHGVAYIADEGAAGGGDGSDAALVVVDLASGAARRLLAGKPGIRSEESPILLGGQELKERGEDGEPRPVRIGVDGIAIDDANEWLYYAPLTGAAVWRARTSDLLDTSLDDDALQARVERYAERPNTGGMWMDAHGDLYLTEVAGRSIGRIRQDDRTYERVLTRDDLYWPDDVIGGPNGALYVVVSQFPAAPRFVGGRSEPQPPFIVVRFEPDRAASAGSLHDAADDEVGAAGEERDEREHPEAHA